MMFYNTLFSFVAAIALASSVTAAVTPRGGGGQICSTGSLVCCTSVSPVSSTSTNVVSTLIGLLGDGLNQDAHIGENCENAGEGNGCNNEIACCDGIQNQSGLVNVGFNCIGVPINLGTLLI